jgi:hypothetical protein
MSNALMGLYEQMKAALKDVGGYNGLSEEQQDLFNNAVDLLLAAKFEHTGVEQVEEAVTAFLSTMSGSGSLPKEESLTGMASLLIRAADALDQANKRELANELDMLLKQAKVLKPKHKVGDKVQLKEDTPLPVTSVKVDQRFGPCYQISLWVMERDLAEPQEETPVVEEGPKELIGE